METVSHYLNKTMEHFKSKNVENSKYVAEKLLSDVLKVDRLQLYLQLQRPLSDLEIKNYRESIKTFLTSGVYKKDISVLTALSLLKKTFLASYVPEAELNAEYIVAHIVQAKRLELKFFVDRFLTEAELKFLSLYKSRRLKREPLEYILGYTEFYGRKYLVNKHTLIPRPETEQLVEVALKYFKTGNVLDIGTGSGCIPISLKLERSELILSSTDISAQAISMAQKNARNLDGDIQFLENDFLNEESWTLLGKYDHIISNPPYITLNDWKGLEPEVNQYEPEIALHDKGDGLTFYKKIVLFCENHLNENGYVALEIGHDQMSRLREIVSMVSYLNVIEERKDYSENDRILILQKVSPNV